jgi:hypothetical protein
LLIFRFSPKTCLVYTQEWLAEARSLIEGCTIPPESVRDTCISVLRSAMRGELRRELRREEKLALTIYALGEEGYAEWDGSAWRIAETRA